MADTEVFTIDGRSEECQREFAKHWETMKDRWALAARCAGASIVRTPPWSRRERRCFLALSSYQGRREGKPSAEELHSIRPFETLLFRDFFLLQEDIFNNGHTSLPNILYFLFGKTGKVLELDLWDRLSINQH